MTARAKAAGVAEDRWWEDAERPWPRDHKPSDGVEPALWRSFAALRAVENNPCSISAICRGANGASRTSLSGKDAPFKRLRKEILIVHAQRKPEKAPTPQERVEAARRAKEERYGGTVRNLVARLQASDSRNAELLAEVQTAQRTSRRAKAMVQRFIDDINAGRWVQADPTATTLREMEALLGPASEVGADAGRVRGQYGND